MDERVSQQNILPNAVHQRHLFLGWIIFQGLEANLPDGTTEVQAYWAYDTKKLYLWNPSTSGWSFVQFT